MKFALSITDWYALSPGLPDQESWRAWAATGERRGEAMPPSPAIPTMTARRMSPVSRLAVQAALTLAERDELDFAVFVSRHAELPRTYQLLQQILASEPASPMGFSQSVHNTAAGLFTIVSGRRLAVTSIAAERDSFQQGMVEAAAVLQSGAARRVLLVVFDDELPAVYRPFVAEMAPCYAIALLLERGMDCSCEAVARGESSGGLPQALVFMQHWLRSEPLFTVPGVRVDWVWSCARA